MGTWGSVPVGEKTRSGRARTIADQVAEIVWGGHTNLQAGFAVLRRTKPLSQSVSVTQTVGAQGGTIKLKDAGVTLEIPAGALSANTAITITAPSGNAVAFTFVPHGLLFATPASLHLDVKGTTAEAELKELIDWVKKNKIKDPVALDAYAGVYFVGDVSGPVQPQELLETSLVGNQIVFDIEHFSGYAVAGGRSGEEDGGDDKPRRKKKKGR